MEEEGKETAEIPLYWETDKANNPLEISEQGHWIMFVNKSLKVYFELVVPLFARVWPETVNHERERFALKGIYIRDKRVEIPKS